MDDDVDQRIHDLESAQASLESQVCARKMLHELFLYFRRCAVSVFSRRDGHRLKRRSCIVGLNDE